MHRTITQIYFDEGLPEPRIMPWPLHAEAEEDRRRRESAFQAGLAANPPRGLEWIRRHSQVKYRPDLILEGCRSVMVSSLGYFREDESDGKVPEGKAAASRKGRVARYARGRDYHKELGNRLRKVARALGALYPAESFRAFTDSGPLDEVWLVEASGAGFRGRNTLAILPGVGSWAVLGHVLSTQDFYDSRPIRPSPLACPDGCRRCIQACPTGALSLSEGIDASRCISYHTIEHSGPIELTHRAGAADRIFGCDVCQEVCPFNFSITPTNVKGFLNDIAGASLSLETVLGIQNHQNMVDLFAGSALMRAGRNGLVRNACTAAANLNRVDLAPLLEELARNDSDPGVRDHAAWALDVLRQSADPYTAGH